MEKEFTEFEEVEPEVSKSFLDKQLEEVREKEFMKNVNNTIPIKKKEDAETWDRWQNNRNQLYYKMMKRMCQFHKDKGFDPNKRLHGIRYDYDATYFSEKKVYVTAHTKINPYVFGIAFNFEEQAEELLQEFKEDIKKYYM